MPMPAGPRPQHVQVYEVILRTINESQQDIHSKVEAALQTANAYLFDLPKYETVKALHKTEREVEKEKYRTELARLERLQQDQISANAKAEA